MVGPQPFLHLRPPTSSPDPIPVPPSTHRKWKVPSRCPNPLPGTTQMPVSSSSFMQKNMSGA